MSHEEFSKRQSERLKEEERCVCVGGGEEEGKEKSRYNLPVFFFHECETEGQIERLRCKSWR